VHGTLISMGLIEHRPGAGTFVVEPPPKGQAGRHASPTLNSAAEKALAAFDQCVSRTKPKAPVEAMDELRDAMR
jgi:DNA-binding GntR family transcriptional regulator